MKKQGSEQEVFECMKAALSKLNNLLLTEGVELKIARSRNKKEKKKS